MNGLFGLSCQITVHCFGNIGLKLKLENEGKNMDKHCFLACSLAWSLSHAQLALLSTTGLLAQGKLPPSLEEPSHINHQSIQSPTEMAIATSHSDGACPLLRLPQMTGGSELVN